MGWSVAAISSIVMAQHFVGNWRLVLALPTVSGTLGAGLEITADDSENPNDFS